jgi:hypothetical protein
MGIFGSMKKGMEIASKSLLMALAALIVLFVGYVIVGFVLGGTILASKFPPIAPDMTPDQIKNLNWSQVNWAMFIPGVIVAFILGFFLNSFTQGGIIASLRDCAKEGKEKILAFFGSGLKYCLPLFIQILLVVVVTVLVVAIGIILMTLVAAIGVVPLVIAIDVVVFLVLLALLIYIAMTLVYGQISLVLNNSGAIKSLGEATGFLKKRMLKALGLFILTGIIYYVIYIVFQLLTGLTSGWPVISRIVWSLATSYIYIFLSIFMLGSFISFYLAAKE